MLFRNTISYSFIPAVICNTISFSFISAVAATVFVIETEGLQLSPMLPGSHWSSGSKVATAVSNRYPEDTRSLFGGRGHLPLPERKIPAQATGLLASELCHMPYAILLPYARASISRAFFSCTPLSSQGSFPLPTLVQSCLPPEQNCHPAVSCTVLPVVVLDKYNKIGPYSFLQNKK